MPAIDEFRALHRPGKPLILFNVWDAGSARAVAQEGARAIATGSYGVAGAQGFEDDESFPITEVLSNARRIITATDLPVTVDFSAGYGDSPEAAGRSVTAVAALGAVGINLEDQLPGENELNPIPAQMKRLRAAADSSTRDAMCFLMFRPKVTMQGEPPSLSIGPGPMPMPGPVASSSASLPIAGLSRRFASSHQSR